MVTTGELEVNLQAVRGPVEFFTTANGQRAAIVVDHLRDVGDILHALGAHWDEVVRIAWSLGFIVTNDLPDYEAPDGAFEVYVLRPFPTIDLRSLGPNSWTAALILSAMTMTRSSLPLTYAVEALAWPT